jgi:peptidoglycan/xylan/chitin deacetylase (PgdA/CDA1 family)
MMTKLSPAQIRMEMVDSKAWLEDVTGMPITSFSFPNGNANALALNLAFEAGYTLVANSRELWNSTSGVKSKRVVNRMGIRASFSMNAFKQIVQQDYLFFAKRRVRSGLLALPKMVLSNNQISLLKRLREEPDYEAVDE